MAVVADCIVGVEAFVAAAFVVPEVAAGTAAAAGVGAVVAFAIVADCVVVVVEAVAEIVALPNREQPDCSYCSTLENPCCFYFSIFRLLNWLV